MKEKIVSYFENNRTEMLSCLSDLVRIRSVRSEPLPGMPFGRENGRALDYMKNLSEKAGLAVRNYDGYVLSAQLNEDEPGLQIFTHLDVVPAGDGWDTDPYRMEMKDGKLYGRGTGDDKGAAIAALFALKAVKDLNIPLSKNCRLVFGTDEECGSSDLKYYFEREKQPELAFTPDSEFPVTVGEKGRFAKHFRTVRVTDGEGKRLCCLYGGKAENAVPDSAFCELEGITENELLSAIKMAETTGAVFETDGNRVTCYGTATHASLPGQGNNPITALVYMLSFLNLGRESEGIVKALNSMFPHGRVNGEGFGICMEDVLGKLTLSFNTVSYDGKSFDGSFDARVPACATEENCARKISAVLAENDFEIDNTEMIPPHYVDENSDFVKTLLSVYKEFTGKDGYCVCVGGGTYVHNMKNGVAFGAIPEDMNVNMHAANEFIPVDALIQAAEIYTGAIINICK